MHHSLVTNCLKGRYTFFVFNEVYLSYLSNVYRACSYFTNLDLFCTDNARVIYRKIRHLLSLQKERCHYFVAQCTVTKHYKLIMINVNCVDAHQVSMGCITNSQHNLPFIFLLSLLLRSYLNNKSKALDSQFLWTSCNIYRHLTFLKLWLQSLHPPCVVDTYPHTCHVSIHQNQIQSP